MAASTHCTLRDLEAYALDRCPLGFRILSDTSQYEFERKVVFHAPTKTARKCDLLCVGYFSDRPNTRVYADLNHLTPPNKIFYYDGQMGENISAASEARKVDPESACFPKNMKHVEPFSIVANMGSSKGSRRAPKTLAQEQNRSKLTLLIKFAYLLTGRVSAISHHSPKEGDMRDEFLKMCTTVQKREDHEKRVVKKEPVKPSNNLGGMAGNSAQPNMHNAWLEQPRDTSEGVFTVPIRASKRKIVDLTNSDDEFGQLTMQGPQVKRRAELDASRASLHPGVGSNDYSMIDDTDVTGGVALTNDMIEPFRAHQAGSSSFETIAHPRAHQAGPSSFEMIVPPHTQQAGPPSLEQRFNTAMHLPEQHHTEPLEQGLLTERERAEKAEREARQAHREARQAKLEAEQWKEKFKKLVGTKVGAFLDAI